MAEDNSKGLAEKVVKVSIFGVISIGTISLGYMGVRESVAGGRVTRLFNEKANIYGREGCIPDCKEKAIAYSKIKVPYDPRDPKELTIEQKRQYLRSVHGIILDRWGNVIKPNVVDN